MTDSAPRPTSARLGDALDGTWAEQRRHGRAVAADERFFNSPGTSTADYRENVLKQLRLLADEGLTAQAFPVAYGGQGDMGGNLASFEELVIADASLQIKAGVQFGLFGGAILHLGNQEQHDRWLRDVVSTETPGSFAMTEIGHGSDVASLGTTATYDPETQEFVLNTPFRAAWKDYIGNAALHAKDAVVFAKLITLGVDHGVHAFYVNIRDDNGEFLPGIQGEDDGEKGGLPGVDNGRFAFEGVRVPLFNLLNRYGQVAPDGSYTSDIENPGRRFFTMLGTLVQGRVSLDGAATAAAKLGLDIAIRYALERRQFTEANEFDETVLLDYQRHQRRLLPRLATIYAQSFAHDHLLQSFDAVFSGKDDSDEARTRLETEAAGYKALSTRYSLDTIQECREACGGAGFLAENRLVRLHSDLDVYTTFEGDNTVLLQLVAKRLLGDYSKEFRTLDVGGAARYMATQAAERTLNRSGLRNIGEVFADAVPTKPMGLRLRNLENQEDLLRERAESMVEELAARLRPATRANKAEAAQIVGAHQHEMIETAIAHVEWQQWQAFTAAVNAVEDPATATILGRLRDLFGLRVIEDHLEWHLMYGRISMNRARSIGSTIHHLLGLLRPDALTLVDAFGYTQEHRRATITSGVEKARQDEARAYYRRQRASADAPIDEKLLVERRRRQRRAEAKS